MDLKNLLKFFKLNESTISMLLGALAIVIVGILIINYSGRKREGETIPPIGTEKEEITLPAVHKVAKGEDLWKISEEYYGTGYNWTDIAEANNLKNANIITAGEELTIPDVAAKFVGEIKPTTTPSESTANEALTTSAEENEPIIGTRYTVVKGDYLWEIAIRAYGDGYRWIDISRANNLVNPNIIHTGNILIIPR